MKRSRNGIVVAATLALGLLAVAPAQAASLTEVTRSTWAGSVSLPSYVNMYIYVPDKVASNPPIVVSGHSCGSTASGQMGNIPHTLAAADKYGFIIILPDNPGQNCWDVGSTKSLTHDGGGDTQAVAQMVRYALTKYNGDASRVYIFGGSSGGILTQGMLAVYPDIFRAGSARAGVPAGCWAVQYDQGGTPQWSGPCATGQVTHTAQEWGDMVRAMYPGYTGHRPRVQLIQGGSDTTIDSKNMPESIKEWTNVLGLSTTPTSSDKGFQGQVASYDRQFWQNACGYTVLESWVAPGKDHHMDYEEDAILKFFGLDTASTADPEPNCTGDGGVADASTSPGSDASGGGGSSGRDGGSVVRDGGSVVHDGGLTGNGGGSGSGGGQGSGGISGVGGSGAGGSGSGGSSAKGTGGETGTGGHTGTGGSSAGNGGNKASGGAQGTGGATGSGGSTSAGNSSSGGCNCAMGGHPSAAPLAGLFLVALGLLLRTRRQRRS